MVKSYFLLFAYHTFILSTLQHHVSSMQRKENMNKKTKTLKRENYKF